MRAGRHRGERQVEQARARQIGLALALIMRLVLLTAIAGIMGLTAPLVAVAGHNFSWRDLILIGGGIAFDLLTTGFGAPVPEPAIC